MNVNLPEPGDHIRMLNIPEIAPEYRNRTFEVIRIDDNGKVFVSVDDDPHYDEKYVLPEWYEIVKIQQTGQQDTCVDDFLKKQLENNLRSAFR